MKKGIPRNYYFWASIVALIVMTFIMKGNIIEYMKAKHTIRIQENRIESLRNEIDRLNNQIESLSFDRDTLETFARERYYFTAEGDDVYIVDE